MKLNKFAYLYSKPLGTHTLKIMKIIPGNLLKKPGTRMHSSRMCTGCALTVSRGGGVGASQKKLWEKNLKKKTRPPQKKPDTPRKNQTPPQKKPGTRMHSSRMCTSRALTVARGGVGASQKKLWEKNLKKKTRPPPQKTRHTPQKKPDIPPGPGQVHPPPPWTDRRL